MESFEFEQQVLFCVNYVLCLSCFNFLYWFIAALWSPAGKELTYWLLFVMFNCIFFHFPMWCPGSGVALDCIDS